MLDTIVNYITNTSLNSTLAITLFWIPLVISLIGYSCEFVRDYHADLTKYQDSYYAPKLTIGSILGRILISLIPFINLWPGVRFTFTLGYDILEACSKALDIPIIRHNPKPKEK